MIRRLEKYLRQTPGITASAPNLAAIHYSKEPGELAASELSSVVHESITLDLGYLSWRLTPAEAEAHAANLLACAAAARAEAGRHALKEFAATAAAAHYTAIAAEAAALTKATPEARP